MIMVAPYGEWPPKVLSFQWYTAQRQHFRSCDFVHADREVLPVIPHPAEQPARQTIRPVRCQKNDKACRAVGRGAAGVFHTLELCQELRTTSFACSTHLVLHPAPDGARSTHDHTNLVCQFH